MTHSWRARWVYRTQLHGLTSMMTLFDIINIYQIGMQQTGSSTKIQVQPNKIRKIKTIKAHEEKIETSKQFNQLQSSQDVQLPEKKPLKPRSSIGRRPLSSKYKQTTNSIASTTTARSEEELKSMIENIFNHSKKLKKFLQDQSLPEHMALGAILNNQIFTLSMVTMISSKSKDEANGYLEKAIINRLERNIAMEEQKLKCKTIENEIGSLINKRLQALMKFI